MRLDHLGVIAKYEELGAQLSAEPSVVNDGAIHAFEDCDKFEVQFQGRAANAFVQ